jgi:hypothetical protein
MKTNARAHPTLAAALLLAVVSLTLGGCSKPESSSPPKVANKPCDRPGITVTVWVYDDGAPKAKTDNKTIYLCEGIDNAQWVSADGFVSEDFQWKDGSPFDEPPRHLDKDRKVLKSKQPKPGTNGHDFDYEAWLVLKDGTKKQIDPRIVVLP